MSSVNRLEVTATVTTSCCRNNVVFGDTGNKIQSYSSILGWIFAKIFGIAVAIHDQNQKIIYVRKRDLDNWLTTNSQTVTNGMIYEEAINTICRNYRPSDDKTTSTAPQGKESNSSKPTVSPAKARWGKVLRKMPSAAALEMAKQGNSHLQLDKNCQEFVSKNPELLNALFTALYTRPEKPFDIQTKLYKAADGVRSNAELRVGRKGTAGKNILGETKKAEKEAIEHETHAMLPVKVGEKWIIFNAEDSAKIPETAIPQDARLLLCEDYNAHWPNEGVFEYTAASKKEYQRIMEQGTISAKNSPVKNVESYARTLDLSGGITFDRLEQISSDATKTEEETSPKKDAPKEQQYKVKVKVNVEPESLASINGPAWAELGRHFDDVVNKFIDSKPEIFTKVKETEWLKKRLTVTKQEFNEFADDNAVKVALVRAYIRKLEHSFFDRLGYDATFVYSPATNTHSARYYIEVLNNSIIEVRKEAPVSSTKTSEELPTGDAV